MAVGSNGLPQFISSQFLSLFVNTIHHQKSSVPSITLPLKKNNISFISHYFGYHLFFSLTQSFVKFYEQIHLPQNHYRC